MNAETGKSINELSLAEGTVTSKVYDGKAFENRFPERQYSVTMSMRENLSTSGLHQTERRQKMQAAIK